MATGLLPRAQRRLTSFLSEERGRISTPSLLSIGSILASSAALTSLVNATHLNQPFPLQNPKCRACHSNNVAHANQVGFGGGGTAEVSHTNAEPYHCSHSNCQPPHPVK